MTEQFITVDDSRSHVLLLGNSKAGTGGALERVDSLVKQLSDRGFEVRRTFDVDEFRKFVEQTPADDIRCVIAAGGDGTAELASSIAGDTPLTVFPIGTENLLAKHFGIAQDPYTVAETVARGRLTSIDIGLANSRPFLLMLSCGFDAEVVRRLDEYRDGNINHLSYAKPILESIRNYQYPPLTLSYWTDETERPSQLTAYWAFVFNVPTYAGGLGICSDASPNDGLLDIVTFQGSSFWHGLYHLSAVVLRQHQNLSEFDSFRAKKIRIESEAEVPYQVDGDPGGFLPVDIEVAARQLHLVIPGN